MRSKKRIKPILKFIEDKWNESPDQRFSQLLINLGIVTDNLRDWNTEITDLPIPHEYIRGIQTWGTRGKDGKSYKELYIKDLETEHIKNIIKTQTHISDRFREIFKNELDFRCMVKRELDLCFIEQGFCEEWCLFNSIKKYINLIDKIRLDKLNKDVLHNY